MIGKPKYKKGQTVQFTITQDGQAITKTGVVSIVDRFGIFEQSTQVSYDIYVDADNCLYKHIVESMVESNTNSK